MEANYFVIALFIIIAFLLGIPFHKLYSSKRKGAKGEREVSRLLRRLSKKKYVVLNDIYIKVDNRSTQIDHLVISTQGIFVIETKNYDGWIHGHEKSQYWTQSFYRKKISFRNPIKQNWAHIFILKSALSGFGYVNYHPIIVFAGKAKLKNISSNIPVIYKNRLLKTVKKTDSDNLSISQVEEIAEYLNEINITDNNREKEHSKYVSRNIQKRDEDVKALVCPNCGGMLQLRNGQYGGFYGCSNYPRCKYSKPV